MIEADALWFLKAETSKFASIWPDVARGAALVGEPGVKIVKMSAR